MAPQHSSLGIPLLCIGLFWVALIYGIAVASIPYNPLSMPRIITMNLQTIIPQGWAFFTRSPREEMNYYYRIEEDALVLQPYQNANWKTALGTSRMGRVKSMELAALNSMVQPEDWYHCDKGIAVCDDWKTLPRVALRNGFRHPQICGELILEKKEIVPWAWSKDIHQDQVPSKIVKLFVVCSN